MYDNVWAATDREPLAQHDWDQIQDSLETASLDGIRPKAGAAVQAGAPALICHPNAQSNGSVRSGPKPALLNPTRRGIDALQVMPCAGGTFTNVSIDTS